MAINKIQCFFDIQYFIDNDKNKYSYKINGFDVMNPNKILEDKGIYVLIASSYENEICKQLKQMGVNDKSTVLINELEEHHSIPWDAIVLLIIMLASSLFILISILALLIFNF
jgi:hypothetical protein